MRQYLEIKEQNPSAIVFFRLGDFYEMFFEDARIASSELELTLTGRDCGLDERAPMCGVPYHSAEAYIGRLIAKGYKVAICEQVEDPATAKGLVKREIIRIITPGTVTEPTMLDEKKNNYIASLYFGENSGLAFIDISTGEVLATSISNGNVEQKIMNELSKFSPMELLINRAAAGSAALKDFLYDKLHCLINTFDDEFFDYMGGMDILKRRFNRALDFSQNEEAVCALGALIKYLEDTQKNDLSHINEITFYSENTFMELDFSTQRNLELWETMRQKEKRGSLLWVLDKTSTAMGARLMRKWIEQPLLNPVHINKRLDALESIYKNSMVRSELEEILSGLLDIERLMSRIVYKSAGARDLIALASTLSAIPALKQIVKDLDSAAINEIDTDFLDLKGAYGLIFDAITDEPPFSVREGGIIKKGYSKEVDELNEIIHNTKGLILELENNEKEKTGIRNLKIGYNKVFGYYIEVTRSYLGLVPDEYIRKQTLANCERYITEDLKNFEGQVMSASEKAVALEYEIFCAVRDEIAELTKEIQRTASAVARLDVLTSLANVAQKNNYTKPFVDYSGKIEIRDGRHPVVEQVMRDSLFVPNDTLLDMLDNRLSIITGPNMAGKSTYMRQSALIVIMAQMGSFVPASHADIGICDKIFTRVGASDDLSAGQSTFMVEMSEVAAILKNATPKSLIIFDEIGRGTSTYDGLSIARAVLEYTADTKKVGAKTMFATHYHEITDLADMIKGVNNYSIAVKKRGDDITFLRKIIKGAADDSYGIEVAKLAGVPDEVIDRAKEILKDIESGDKTPYVKKDGDEIMDDQVSMQNLEAMRVYGAIQGADLNVLTPIEAMNLIFKLQRGEGV